MRVLQLIDSLEAGGAERVAVNIANGLVEVIEESFLCATRKEGLLKKSISKDVEYLFLNKKKIIDIRSIKILNRFIITKKIDVIHAHASSFFLATLVKVVNGNVKIVWHEHYGNREETSIFNKLILKLCSFLFSTIIAVNRHLKDWSKKSLNTKLVYTLPNFVINNEEESRTKLQGKLRSRIVCLANLRRVKDHATLLKAFSIINKSHPDWSLHLVGKDYEDDYSNEIKKEITLLGLSNVVFIYGSCRDTFNILNQSDIGVLSSKSEGLPMAMLEYGLSKLPVVATNVGDCNLIIKDMLYGRLVKPNNKTVLAKALLELVEDELLRDQLGMRLYKHVIENYSREKKLNDLVNIYNKVL